MERYERQLVFRFFPKLTSFVNVGCQLALVWLLMGSQLSPAMHLAIAGVAFVLADFVGGWVHLHMDNGDDYSSATGPFYAAFHLHHRTPKYRKRTLIQVYYEEAGSKLWLAVVACSSVVSVGFGWVRPWQGFFLLYFAVFSCVAEVSHYLCHTPNGTFAVKLLTRCRILLSSRQHARHHRNDNVQYAFLNGMTDPLLDWIAKRYYAGYKSTTDLHYARYVGADTSNRPSQGPSKRNSTSGLP